MNQQYYSSTRLRMQTKIVLSMGKKYLLLLSLICMPLWAQAQPQTNLAKTDLTLEQASYAPGLSQLVGIVGQKSKTSILIRVLRHGKPAVGEEVDFRLLTKARERLLPYLE